MNTKILFGILLFVIGITGYYVIEKGDKIKYKWIHLFVRILGGFTLLILAYYEYQIVSHNFLKPFQEISLKELFKPGMCFLAGLLFIFVLTPLYWLDKSRSDQGDQIISNSKIRRKKNNNMGA